MPENKAPGGATHREWYSGTRFRMSHRNTHVETKHPQQYSALLFRDTFLMEQLCLKKKKLGDLIEIATQGNVFE